MTKASRYALAALLVLQLMGCATKERWFEAEVDIVRMDVVRRDAEGNPLTSDIEVSYEQCPGTQREVIRGGRDFTACVFKHGVGDTLKAKIRWYEGDHGYFESKVHALGDCDRPPDPEDEASFTVVRDCEQVTVHGASVGFRCHYVDQGNLTAKCPWFKRR